MTLVKLKDLVDLLQFHPMLEIEFEIVHMANIVCFVNISSFNSSCCNAEMQLPKHYLQCFQFFLPQFFMQIYIWFEPLSFIVLHHVNIDIIFSSEFYVFLSSSASTFTPFAPDPHPPPPMKVYF